MNYETIELKTKRLIIKKGIVEDFLKVYEYDFKKLMDIDDKCELVKQDLKKIKKCFIGGIKRYYSKIKKAHMFDWIIFFENVPIGNILTKDDSLENNTIELTYNMHPSYWGNGYMPEALSEVINYLFSLGYENIVSNYYDGNIKAKRVMNKLGFKPHKIIEDDYETVNGNLIDNYKMIMTKEDWFSRTTKIAKIK